jgi:four helix bundle protein
LEKICLLPKTLPENEKYGLVSQINRCVISIPADIAQGSAKYYQKHFVRILQISLGSAYELESNLKLCTDLEFINSTKISSIIVNVQLLQKRIA